MPSTTHYHFFGKCCTVAFLNNFLKWKYIDKLNRLYCSKSKTEFCSQGSEIFTVFAKDGDMENPNPVIYSIDSGMYYFLK